MYTVQLYILVYIYGRLPTPTPRSGGAPACLRCLVLSCSCLVSCLVLVLFLSCPVLVLVLFLSCLLVLVWCVTKTRVEKSTLLYFICVCVCVCVCGACGARAVQCSAVCAWITHIVVQYSNQHRYCTIEKRAESRYNLRHTFQTFV